MPSDDEITRDSLLEALRKLNHELRTPLGVALNVCRDGEKGLKLEHEDFQDAVKALQKINQLLAEFKVSIK